MTPLTESYLIKYYLSQPNEVRLALKKALELKGIKISIL